MNAKGEVNLRNMRRIASTLAILILSMVLVIGCSTNQPSNNSNNNQPDPGTQQANQANNSDNDTSSQTVDEIYFLNFKPEIAEVYERVAEAYEQETGVAVKVVTAAAGTYETRLRSEIVKSDPPTIFQINGPVGYQNWKEYTADLKDTKLYSYLSDKSLAVTSGDGVYGIPYVVEGYGIIYNDAILRDYFALPDKAVDISSAEEINNFATLKAVVEDMQAKKGALGIEGVFASTSMAPGEQWRWQTHLANLPFYHEFQQMDGYDNPLLAGLDAAEIEFSYADAYKNIFDLYLNNSVVQSTLVGSKSVDDSMAEFALGRAAMVQNGNWAWAQINGVDGNTVKAEDIKFLPIYTGVDGEEGLGLSIGTENYFAINSQVSPELQAASVAFLEWLFSSDTGKQFVLNDLGFIAPFNTFGEDEKPTDPLAKEVTNWMDKGLTSVPWTFAAFPSEEFKNIFGGALLLYAQGSTTWDEVVAAVEESWKSEKSKISQ